jgi:energy-converting hydrogenase Eha subunit A
MNSETPFVTTRILASLGAVIIATGVVLVLSINDDDPPYTVSMSLSEPPGSIIGPTTMIAGGALMVVARVVRGAGIYETFFAALIAMCLALVAMVSEVGGGWHIAAALSLYVLVHVAVAVSLVSNDANLPRPWVRRLSIFGWTSSTLTIGITYYRTAQNIAISTGDMVAVLFGYAFMLGNVWLHTWY